MIAEGLDYEKHYAAFNGTDIEVLERQSRALANKAYDLKRSCYHPEKHLQWLSQGDVNLFYCGTCGSSFTYEARNSMDDFINKIRRANKRT